MNEVVKRYPMKLKPVLKDIIWGGTRLADEFNKSNNDHNGCNESKNVKIAESWELAVHPNGKSIIENGEYAGKSLEELFRLDKSIVAHNYSGEKFPILIKFIDAEQDLSVQVHPDNEYAAKNSGESGKTEMWYIIDSKPGAKIVYGLNGDYTRAQLQNLVDCGRFEDCLNYAEAKPGDVFFIPAGLVHAIGAGILIAEIQQNSDTTYRFYDYNRIGADGVPRELHIEKALDVCIKTKTVYQNPKRVCEEVPVNENLCSCKYFNVDKFKNILEFTSRPAVLNSFNSVICINGNAEIICEGKIYKIKKGGSYFIPAGLKEYCINNVAEDFEFVLTSLF